MEFIWSRDKLESLLKHPSEDVRHWAVSRLLDLYPDMRGHIAGLLPSASRWIDTLILTALVEEGFPIPTDILEHVIQSPVDTDIKAVAAALLISQGHSPPSEIGTAALEPCSTIMVSTDKGFEFVLGMYSRSGPDNEYILRGLAEAGNLTDPFSSIIDARNDKEIEGLRKHLGRFWDCDLPPVRGATPEHTLFLVEERLAATLQRSDAAWKDGLFAELEDDRRRLAAICQTARQRGPNWSEKEGQFFSACLWCLRRNDACVKRLATAGDAAGLWNALVLKPWRDEPSPPLTEFLSSARPKELLTSSEKALSQAYTYASYTFKVLNLMDTAGRFRLFLDLLQDPGKEQELAGEAVEALSETGAPAARYVIEHWNDLGPDVRILVLPVLDALPTEAVVDFYLDRFEYYMTDPDSPEFVSSLQVIASARFLPGLLKEWREGEVQLGEAIKLIADVNGIQNEEIEKVAMDTGARVRRPERVMEKPMDEPIRSFRLRCTNCRHIYDYVIEHINVDHKGKAFIGDIIQCKGCGSIETYELPALTRFAITAELVRVASIVAAEKGASEKPDMPETPIRFVGEARVTVLNKTVESMGDAYRLIKNNIKKHPADPRLHRAMGNLLRNGGRPDLAMPYYLEAISLDPGEIQARYAIADIFMEDGKYQEALPHLKALIPLVREGNLEETVRRHLFTFLLDASAVVQEETGSKLEILPVISPDEIKKSDDGPVIAHLRTLDPSKKADFETLYHVFRHGRAPLRSDPLNDEDDYYTDEAPLAPVVKGPKVGRNAPCPCGSGKKYKRCCGK